MLNVESPNGQPMQVRVPDGAKEGTQVRAVPDEPVLLNIQLRLGSHIGGGRRLWFLKPVASNDGCDVGDCVSQPQRGRSSRL